jgi:hypothetical protein
MDEKAHTAGAAPTADTSASRGWRIHSACVLRAAPYRAIEEGPGLLVTDIGEVADLVDRGED